MNRNIKTASMTEAAMISGILVIFAYISTFLVSLLMFFYPIPVIILAKRRGMKYAILSLVAADFIITMLLGIQTGVAFILMLSPLAIALSYGIYKDESPNKTILLGAAAFMISFVATILLMQLIMGVNFIEQLVQITNESFSMYREILMNTASDTNADKINDAIRYIDDTSKVMTAFLSQQFPSMLISSSFIVSLINYFTVSKFSKRFSIDIRQHEGLSYFSFPNTFILAMAALLLLSFLLSVFKVNVVVIQMNLFMLCYMAMFVQGFAVAKFYLIKWNVNKVGRTLILIMMVFVAGFAQVLAVVGIVDLVFDMRKIRRKIV